VSWLSQAANLGRQTLKKFQAFRTPEEDRSFTELYNVQHMQSNVTKPDIAWDALTYKTVLSFSTMAR
jgi:hypothetical protein